MRVSADFSAGQKTVNIFKVLKRKKKCLQRIIYLEKSFFRNKWEIKTSPDKLKLREFITTGIDLQEILKVALQVEIKGCHVTIWKHRSIKLTGTGKIWLNSDYFNTVMMVHKSLLSLA